MRLLIFTVAAWLALTLSADLSYSKSRIAVMPLKAERVDESVVKVLDAILVSQVSRLGAFDVISAADIEAMLQAEGIKDALGCDTVTCAAEIGGALDAKATLTGSVGRLGSSITINLALFDNEKMIVLGRSNVEVEDKEDALRAGLRSAVEKLFGVQVSESGQPVSPFAFQAPATLEVTSSIPDAYVIIDGKLAGKTPLSVGVRPGEHTVDIEKEGVIPFRTSIALAPGEHLRREVMLGKALSDRSVDGVMVALGFGAAILGVSAFAAPFIIDALVDSWSSGAGTLLIGVSFGVLFSGTAVVAWIKSTPQSQPAPRFLHKIDDLEQYESSLGLPPSSGLSFAWSF